MRIAWTMAMAAAMSAAGAPGDALEACRPAPSLVAHFDGRPLVVHEARCSAYPLNQEWPGYQRPIEQSQVQFFVSFDIARPGVLEIEAQGLPSPEPLRIRPLSRPGDMSVEDGVLRVHVSHPEQFVIEFCDGSERRMPTALHVFVNPPFRYEHVPDEIYFGPGTHDTGLIAPTNGQTVCIDEGAVVYGAIFIDRARDVRVVGRGILDSSRVERADKTSEIYRRVKAMGHADGTAARACTNFQAFQCENLYVEGIIFRDSPRWSVILRNECDGALIENVKLIGMWRYNSDGIDVCASRNVVIRDSFIRSFDDCFVARGVCLEGETGPVENVTVENCVLWCDWGKNLEVWAGNEPCVIKNVTCRDCKLVNVDAYACDVTTWGESANTVIRDIRFENLEIDLCRPRWQSRLETRHKGPFDFAERDSCALFSADIRSRNGAKAQNAGRPDARVEYSGLVFAGFKVFDETESGYVGFLSAPGGSARMEDVSVMDMPPGFHLRRSGDVGAVLFP